MLYQDCTDANKQLVNLLYACRQDRSACAALLPEINRRAPVRYCDAGPFMAELLAMFDLPPLPRPIEDYLEEILNDRRMEAQYNLAVERNIVRAWPNKPIRSFRDKVLIDHYHNSVSIFIYAFLRELRPDIVVETGTCSGSISSMIVAALHNNGRGRLISIDLPPSRGKMPTIDGLRDEDVGFLIPPEYRGSWELRVGDARELLPQVMMTHDVDVFFHDSLHTRSHMAFEYAVARTFMKDGAVIFSDDTLFNHAFYKFVETHGLPALGCVNNPQIAFCRNRFDDFERGFF